jgi:regulator of telomere elongation helicase 1
LSGYDWYQQEASRAVNQAIGRVIRHANDYGAIILAESRFDNRSFIDCLSSWVRPRVQRCELFKEALAGINTFFNKAKNVRTVGQIGVRRESGARERGVPILAAAVQGQACDVTPKTGMASVGEIRERTASAAAVLACVDENREGLTIVQ